MSVTNLYYQIGTLGIVTDGYITRIPRSQFFGGGGGMAHTRTPATPDAGAVERRSSHGRRVGHCAGGAWVQRSTIDREHLGRGRTLDEARSAIPFTVEGPRSAGVIMQLATSLGVDLPICAEMDAVVNHGRAAQEAYRGLLRRSTNPALQGR